VDKWGLSSLALCGVALTLQPICERLLHYGRSGWLLPYFLLQVTALAFSIVASVRRNKWWLIASSLEAALTIQAVLALLVE